MADATQKLADEARAEAERRYPMTVLSGGVAADRRAFEQGAEWGAAQRPPVSPEAEDALVDAIEEAWTDDDPEFSRVIARRILARFTIPSQPVYDEEAIARWLFGLRYHSMHWLDAKEPERDEYRREAAALVAALRGGELTREETNE